MYMPISIDAVANTGVSRPSISGQAGATNIWGFVNEGMATAFNAFLTREQIRAMRNGNGLGLNDMNEVIELSNGGAVVVDETKQTEQQKAVQRPAINTNTVLMLGGAALVAYLLIK